MTRLATRIFVCLLFAVVPPVTHGALGQSDFAKFEASSLTVQTQKGRYDFAVELALTPNQHAQGLMFRRKMEADAGMLFVYEPPSPISMWMKNTFIPLDMVFIGSDGKVSKIVERTVPMSLATISSDGPAAAVLELNAGTSARIGLKMGDEVRWRRK